MQRPASAHAPLAPVPLFAVAALFVASGAAGLVDQLCFSKYLGQIVGATAQAVSAVLAAFMTGMALGATLGGRFAKRVRRPLVAYGVLEIVVAVFVALTPFAFGLLEPLYVSLVRALPDSRIALSVLRWLLAALVVVVPTTAMGATLPLLARLVEDRAGADERKRALGVLYASNTLGGALGAIASAYVILPALGLRATTLAAALLSAVVGLAAIALGRRSAAASASANAAAPASVEPDATSAEAEPVAVAADAPARAPSSLWSLDVAAFASGALVFSCEVLFFHLLVLVVGTSAYAFGIILFVFLVCLFAGASLAPLVARRFGQLALATSLGATALALALTIPLWDDLPALFRGLGGTITSFEGREAMRAGAAFAALAVPTTLMGLSFPLLLQRAATESDVGRLVGRLTAINTVGSVLGSLAAGYLVLPMLGSQRSLLAVTIAFAVCALLVALSSASAASPRARFAPALLALVAIVVGASRPAWDLDELTGGYHVYFDAGRGAERIVFVAEEVQGGVTTVTEKDGVHTLLTNGKFQGNDGGEVDAQRFFAHYPSLFVQRHERALVIGLGTGTTLGTLAAYPYAKIDVAEISPTIVRAARAYFGAVGAAALDDPRVSLHLADGRNHLLVTDARYDLVGIELTSVWFAGASSLYSREFYQLVASRLAPGGILQQWIQLHHIDARDLATVIHTLRLEFEHVALFYGGGQGILVASKEPLRASRVRLDALEAGLGALRPSRSLASLTADVLVTGPRLDDFVRDAAEGAGLGVDELVSTDDNLYLEYATPRGNVLPWSSREDMVAKLYGYRDVAAIARLNAP